MSKNYALPLLSPSSLRSFSTFALAAFLFTSQAQASQGKATTEIKLGEPMDSAIVANNGRIENWVYYTVLQDDNLTSIFKRAGLSATDVHYVNEATKADKIFSRMMPGQKLAVVINDGKLAKVKYITSALKSVLISRTDNSNYAVKVFERTPDIGYKYVEGDIQNSLFVDALNSGLSNNMTMNFAKVFAWDIDFSQDLKKGDSFKVVYEEKLIDGKRIKDGNIVAAEFNIGGQNHIGIFYRDTEGGVGFYTPDGRSMRKAFLRMPVEFARISSKYNLKRRHPILNRIRAHKGVDYAAKTGTPIMASGNGKIISRGRKGEFGNAIIIQHGTSFTSLYAHMSRFNPKFKLGSRVKQGDIIGYVGATGKVTGAHLHYEFRVDGVHQNPLTVKLPKAISLDKKELALFAKVAKSAQEKLQAPALAKAAKMEAAKQIALNTDSSATVSDDESTNKTDIASGRLQAKTLTTPQTTSGKLSATESASGIAQPPTTNETVKAAVIETAKETTIEASNQKVSTPLAETTAKAESLPIQKTPNTVAATEKPTIEQTPNKLIAADVKKTETADEVTQASSHQSNTQITTANLDQTLVSQKESLLDTQDKTALAASNKTQSTTQPKEPLAAKLVPSEEQTIKTDSAAQPKSLLQTKPESIIKTQDKTKVASAAIK